MKLNKKQATSMREREAPSSLLLSQSPAELGEFIDHQRIERGGAENTTLAYYCRNHELGNLGQKVIDFRKGTVDAHLYRKSNHDF